MFFSLFSQKKKPTPFTSQKNLLKQHPMLEKGICGPLTNSYLTYILNNPQSTPDWLKDENDTFTATYQEAQKIQELKNQGTTKDLEHSAFLRHDRQNPNTPPHEDRIVPRSEVTNAEAFLKLTENKQATTVKFPNSTTDNHMVAFVRDTPAKNSNPSEERCRFFDANVGGGEQKGRCDVLAQVFTKLIENDYPENAGPATVGMK